MKRVGSWVKAAWGWLKYVLGVVAVVVLAIITGRAVRSWMKEKGRRRRLARELARRTAHREIEERCRDELEAIPIESARELRARADKLAERLRRRNEEGGPGSP